MFEAIAFYTFSILTIIMFYITVTSKQPLIALSSLAAGMIFISGFFFTLGAEFLGAVQIIVYTGAVMALYAFGMMFFDTSKDLKEKIENPKILLFLTVTISLLVVAILAAPIVADNIIISQPMGISAELNHPHPGNSQDIGVVLFTKYLVPFELAAVMLLVAMIAGIILAGKKMDVSITLTKEEDEEIEFNQHQKEHL